MKRFLHCYIRKIYYLICSTKVAKELRAGNLDGAKHVTAVGFKQTIPFVGALCVALLNHHIAWAGFFSHSAEITYKFTSMVPLLLIFFILEFTRGNLSGQTFISVICISFDIQNKFNNLVIGLIRGGRGCGWERSAICIDLVSFYVIGIPIAGLVAFKFI